MPFRLHKCMLWEHCFSVSHHNSLSSLDFFFFYIVHWQSHVSREFRHEISRQDKIDDGCIKKMVWWPPRRHPVCTCQLLLVQAVCCREGPQYSWQSFKRQLLKYSGHVFDKYEVDSIALTISIHATRSDISEQLQDTDQLFLRKYCVIIGLKIDLY